MINFSFVVGSDGNVTSIAYRHSNAFGHPAVQVGNFTLDELKQAHSQFENALKLATARAEASNDAALRENRRKAAELKLKIARMSQELANLKV